MSITPRQAVGCGSSLVALKRVDPVFMALPRGGMPVAAEEARVLLAPLDLLMVQKIGAPGQRELAVAAVVDGNSPALPPKSWSTK